MRIIAGVSLGVAAVMLVLGRTALEPYLEGAAFVIWWVAVLGLVLTAFAMAMLDLADLRRQLTADKKELLKTYLLDKKFLGHLEDKIGERKEQRQQAGEQEEAGSRAGESDG